MRNGGKCRRWNRWTAGGGFIGRMNPAVENLAIIMVEINGKLCRGFVDSGCNKSLVCDNLCDGNKDNSIVKTFNGDIVKCQGKEVVNMKIVGKIIQVEMIVVEKLLDGVDAIIGLDIIFELGGVSLSREKITFGIEKLQNLNVNVATMANKKLSIEDKDFCAKFDGERWIMRWKWKENVPKLTNQIGIY